MCGLTRASRPHRGHLQNRQSTSPRAHPLQTTTCMPPLLTPPLVSPTHPANHTLHAPPSHPLHAKPLPAAPRVLPLAMPCVPPFCAVAGQPSVPLQVTYRPPTAHPSVPLQVTYRLKEQLKAIAATSHSPMPPHNPATPLLSPFPPAASVSPAPATSAVPPPLSPPLHFSLRPSPHVPPPTTPPLTTATCAPALSASYLPGTPAHKRRSTYSCGSSGGGGSGGSTCPGSRALPPFDIAEPVLDMLLAAWVLDPGAHKDCYTGGASGRMSDSKVWRHRVAPDLLGQHKAVHKHTLCLRMAFHKRSAAHPSDT